MSIYFKTLIFLAIGLAIIIFSLYKTPVNKIQQKDYKIELSQYSLNFYTNKSEEIFKISPLDDYYYLSNLKEHLVKDSGFSQNRSLLRELTLTLERLFLKQQHLVWSLKDNQRQIIYTVSDWGDGIRIERSLKGFDPKTLAIGQAITFCQDCLLTDADKQVFLLENLVTPEKLAQINKLKLTPIIISSETLPSVSKLLVLNSFGSRILEISVEHDQQAFYFENWHVLELKTPVTGKNSVSTSQIVNLKP